MLPEVASLPQAAGLGVADCGGRNADDLGKLRLSQARCVTVGGKGGAQGTRGAGKGLPAG
jgi:hypothetical protein